MVSKRKRLAGLHLHEVAREQPTHGKFRRVLPEVPGLMEALSRGANNPRLQRRTETYEEAVMDGFRWNTRPRKITHFAFYPYHANVLGDRDFSVNQEIATGFSPDGFTVHTRVTKDGTPNPVRAQVLPEHFGKSHEEVVEAMRERIIKEGEKHAATKLAKESDETRRRLLTTPNYQIFEP